jgi:hypothetical protein
METFVPFNRSNSATKSLFVKDSRTHCSKVITLVSPSFRESQAQIQQKCNNKSSTQAGHHCVIDAGTGSLLLAGYQECDNVKNDY